MPSAALWASVGFRATHFRQRKYGELGRASEANGAAGDPYPAGDILQRTPISIPAGDLTAAQMNPHHKRWRRERQRDLAPMSMPREDERFDPGNALQDGRSVRQEQHAFVLRKSSNGSGEIRLSLIEIVYPGNPEPIGQPEALVLEHSNAGRLHDPPRPDNAAPVIVIAEHSILPDSGRKPTYQLCQRVLPYGCMVVYVIAGKEEVIGVYLLDLSDNLVKDNVCVTETSMEVRDVDEHSSGQLSNEVP